MIGETWRPVPHAPDYAVSDAGRLVSHRGKRPRPMRPTRNAAGYLVVRLDGRLEYVHRLVAATFLGPQPEGSEVRHLNGRRDESHVGNLAWGTHSENMRDRLAHGTDPYASRTHCPQNHPYDEANTYVLEVRGRQRRFCRACKSADSTRRMALRRAA